MEVEKPTEKETTGGDMKRFIEGIVIGVISGVLVTVVGYYIVEQVNKQNPNKIIAYLPYANDYFYEKGGTYKDATPDPAQNMSRVVDPTDPIPLNLTKGKQKLTIGVRNANLKTIDDVKLFLEFPREFRVTDYYPWAQYTKSSYYIPLGNINSGVGHTAIEPIFFEVKQPGEYIIKYSIVGGNFQSITRPMTFKVYEK